MVYQEKIKFFTRDNVEFKGTLRKPSNLKDCNGIVIFTHGLGYCERQYKMNWDFFSQNDYALFTYNLRGHAGNEGVWTLDACVEDLSEIISFLSNKLNFESRATANIVVFGHSTGALISLLAAIKDRRIKAGTAVTTVTCLTHSFLYWFKSGFNQEVKAYFTTRGILPSIINQFMDNPSMLDRYRQNKIPKQELEIPHRYGMLNSKSWDHFFNEIAYSVDIFDFYKKIEIPLLLVRGENDEVMDPGKTDELYNKLILATPSKLVITPSQNHFQNDKWDMIQSKALNFFNDRAVIDLKKAHQLYV